MTLPAEFAKDFSTFPNVLRQLVEAELKSGNTIVAIEHGFPAAPCGASVKLAQAVKTERRKSVGELKFYARNNSSYAGEFTTEPRHFFVLEPPLPPEPEPDMNAIRQAAQGQPNLLDQLAQRPTGSSVAIALGNSFSSSNSSESGGELEKESTPATKALTSTETATGAKRLLHFRDHRPPHEVQFALERNLMTLFDVAMKDHCLTMTAHAQVVGAAYDIELRFEAAMLLKNCYSLRVETSWAKSAATHHDYYRKTSDSWFSLWTRDFMPANPPAADAGSSARYQKICAASLNAEAHLDTVPAIQQTIIAAMKRGAGFSTSHKEGGTNISWLNGHFVRSDYGDYPEHKVFAGEADFLEALRKFYDWETSRNIYPEKVSDFVAWKLILRLLRTK